MIARENALNWDGSKPHYAGGLSELTREEGLVMKVRVASAPVLRAARAPECAPRVALRRVALLAAAIAVASAGSALAQAPAPKGPVAPGPKGATPLPKAGAPQQPPAAAAPAAPGGLEVPPLVYTPWTKFCNPQQHVCVTFKEGYLETGRLMVGATIIEPEGSTEKGMTITVPLGVVLQAGVKVVVDQGQPLNAQFTTCGTGCVAEYELSPELLGKLKKGQSMVLRAVMPPNQPVNIPLALSDFGKAYDGQPSPPQELEERQRKMQEGFAKKIEQLQLQQQQQQQAAPK